MSDEKSTFGKITLVYIPEGETESVTVESPNDLLDDSRKLIHVLNQKSDSGRGLFQSCVDYVNLMVSSRKIPLSATMTVENDDHRMITKLEDYFQFISAAGNVALESFGSKTSEIGLSWLAEEAEDESVEESV